MSNITLTAGQIRFIDDLANLLGTWGVSAHAARLYGYLQMMNEPVSLDDIARDLEISRSHAHSAARTLEAQGNARAIATRGSRRILYVCGEDPGMTLLQPITALGKMSDLIAKNASEVAEGKASLRLARLAKFHKKLRQAMQLVADQEPTVLLRAKSRPPNK